MLERVTRQRSAWSAILNREQTPVAILLACFLCLYLLLANQFASHGVVWIVGVPASPGGGSVPGVGGHLYAAHDVGMALILLPMAILQTAHVLPASGALFPETLVNPVSAACLVSLFFVFGRRLGAPNRGGDLRSGGARNRDADTPLRPHHVRRHADRAVHTGGRLSRHAVRR